MHQLPQLPFAYDALEPFIDSATMQIHHGKHHAGYVEKLNRAVADTPWQGKPVEELLLHLDELPEGIRDSVRKHGGGHYNHSHFWRTLAPPGGRDAPEGELMEAITGTFGSFGAFQRLFKSLAVSRFGSGWAWLCVDADGDLHCATTPNQDACFIPRSTGGLGPDHSPILGLDLWEHAYYLRYHHERDLYVEAWWNVVNWERVAENLARAREHRLALSASTA